MREPEGEMTEPKEDTIARLLDAILPHVAFDGWSGKSFDAAVSDAGIDPAEARRACPRGAVDLAVALHRRGDAEMLRRLEEIDLAGMRIRDRVATALKLRVGAMTDDREAIRRASALFALPIHGTEGTRLLWETADHVWTALGDPSRDGNWYTKRAILATVWASVVLFWLGDESPGHADTDAFIERRIDDVMRFEKLKAGLRENPVTRPLAAIPDAILSRLKPPARRDDMPGRWSR